MDEDLKAYLGAMESRLLERIERLHERIEPLHERFERLNERIDAVESRLNERIERVETQLLTEFHKWASPVEMRQRTHAAAIRAMDAEVEALADRVSKLEGH